MTVMSPQLKTKTKPILSVNCVCLWDFLSRAALDVLALGLEVPPLDMFLRMYNALIMYEEGASVCLF